MSKNNIAVLIMVKNEETSIKLTINSFKDYFSTVIVLDTGSTDKTISVIRETCTQNNQQLYLKETVFKSFPESRNDALDFADTIKNIDFLILMDAGDEFKTSKSRKELCKAINNIPKNCQFGVVTQKWLQKTSLDEHCDIRLVRNNKGCRYDVDCPVHEKFKNVSNTVTLNELFYLYQDRNMYGVSSEKRYTKDIELLSKAKPTKRNLYFLAQSYMSINDFENGYKYNLLSYETKDEDFTDFDEKFTLVRIGYCAWRCNMSKEIIFKYLKMSIDNTSEPPIDSYIYILKYCFENNIPHEAIPFLKPLSKLKKPNANITLVNNEFYDYLRWHLISVVCLSCNYDLNLGKYACLTAIKARNSPNDYQNLKLFN